MLSLVWKVLIGQNIRASHDLIHCMAAHSPITELDSQISGLVIVKFQMRSSVRSRPTIYARAWCQLWCTMYSLTNFLAMSFFFSITSVIIIKPKSFLKSTWNRWFVHALIRYYRGHVLYCTWTVPVTKLHEQST